MPPGCPLSEAGLVKAINEGTYPFDDASARQKMSANFDDYVPLPDGLPPQRATGPSRGRVSTGAEYAEYVRIAEETATSSS